MHQIAYSTPVLKFHSKAASQPTSDPGCFITEEGNLGIPISALIKGKVECIKNPFNRRPQLIYKNQQGQIIIADNCGIYKDDRGAWAIHCDGYK